MLVWLVAVGLRFDNSFRLRAVGGRFKVEVLLAWEWALETVILCFDPSELGVVAKRDEGDSALGRLSGDSVRCHVGTRCTVLLELSGRSEGIP